MQIGKKTKKQSGEKRDNSKTILVATITTTVVLCLISFIPYKKIGNIEIKRANMLSDIISFNDEIISNKTSKDILDTSFLADLQIPLENAMPEYAETSRDTLNQAIQADIHNQAIANQHNGKNTILPPQKDNQTEIEDFSDNGKMMTRFYHALENESPYRTIRIAFLGDSFIESDILTADLREQLQSIYGGEGVGFVPFANPLSKYKPTISHNYDNWEYYSLLKKKNAPENIQQEFFLSGILCVPQPGATTEFSGSNYKKHLGGSSTAKLLFKNHGRTTLEVVVNKTDTLNYTPKASNDIQQIDIDLNKNIHSLSLTLPECEGFIGYGAVFENRTGVSVHNFGLRSNSGLALFSSNQDVNKQMSKFINYDLVVLEYGLNVMQNDVIDYTYYGKQLRRLIDFIKQCCPNSAILVMSIGDVGMKQDDNIVTSPAVEHMIAAQREAAYDKGVAFWNLFNVMGGENSMQQFVLQGWAAKDYTHINHKGGSIIANKLMHTFSAAMEQLEKKEQMAYIKTNTE